MAKKEMKEKDLPEEVTHDEEEEKEKEDAEGEEKE